MGRNLFGRKIVMKKSKIIASILFFLLTTAQTFAQESESEKNATGAGISLSSASDKPPESKNSEMKTESKKKADEKTEIPEEFATEIASEKIALDDVVPAEDEAAELREMEDEVASQLDEKTVEEEVLEKPKILEVAGLFASESEWSQAMIKKYVDIYTAERGKKTLQAILSRGEEYRIFIRTRLKELSLPRALEYLPVVESEYSINATSRSGAKGLWQFMENSIKPYLRKSDWLDERLDPWKSTEAALKKLKENYDSFGDWALALAAYNCGAGLIKKTIQANPEMTYWDLAEKGLLKNQTAHYVPKLIAIAELCENSQKYALDLPQLSDDDAIIEYDYVETKKPVNLSKLAAELNLDAKTIKKLNPAMIRNVSPPGAGFPIRIPLGMKEKGEKAVEKVAMELSDGATLFVEHKIEQGDTLWALSRSFGCTVADLCDLNGISEKAILKLGKVLYIPMK